MPNPYADMVARIILQAAEANAEAAAREQDRAMRREEFRQNLALQREELGFRRSESEARRSLAVNQDAREAAAAKREADKYQREVDLQQQADAETEMAATLAADPNAFVGVKPAAESASGKVKLRARAMQAEDAANADKLAEAQAGPERRALAARREAAQIAAAEAQTKKFNLDIANNDEDRAFLRAQNAAVLQREGIQSEAAKLDLEQKRYDFGKRKVEDRLMRLGIRSPETRAAIYDKLAPVLATQVFEVAARSASSTDPLTGRVDFDSAKFSKTLTEMTPYVDAAAKAATLDVTDPAKAATMRAAMKATAEKLAAAGSNPKAIGDALVGMLNAAIPDKKEPPPQTPQETESGRRLAVKAAKTKDIENRIQYSIQQTIQELPDDLVAKLESKYGGDMAKIVAAIREKLGKEMDSVPSNSVIAAAARSAVGRISFSPFSAAPTQ